MHMRGNLALQSPPVFFTLPVKSIFASIKNKKFSRLTKALLETAKDMRNAKIMTQDTYDKITMRHLGHKEKAEVDLPVGEITGLAFTQSQERLTKMGCVRHLSNNSKFVLL